MLDKILALNWALIFAALWAIGEVLAQIPSIQASSFFQLIWGVMKTIKEKLLPKPENKL